ncbi:aspartate/glutamate racemase family protein [Ochrovirga pacifica]|uniref:aspartate/glutamate racemase family protein n=1 Tax=Ochrovirga pacifica TaxID=1042376 RepID=UPI000255836D|nr:aspartate/glutamate racemase family protein [Ochrovirga pacifica]
MCVLGLLGLGNYSTLFYIKELNQQYQQQKGGYSTCPFIMLNTDFNTINPYLPHPSETLNRTVQHYIHQLETLAPDCILIPNITLHQTIDLLKINTPILHPVTLCLQKLQKNNVNSIVIFATKHTMTSSYLPQYFQSKHIDVKKPTPSDVDFIDTFRQRVYHQQESPEEITQFYSIIQRYTQTTSVVLACTELSIYNPKANGIYDMVQIQIQAAVDKIL